MAPPCGRFAPTPSGRLHIGNLFCALLAYLSARHAGGRFLVRIEDLDRPRCPASLARDNLESLRYLGITWDEPPLWQSQRDEAYEESLSALRKTGRLYPCFCTRQQLLATRAPNLGDGRGVYPLTCYGLSPEETARRAALRTPALRLHVPEEVVSFTDLHMGKQAFDLPSECGDFIVRRSDGLFAYNLAVVVDDAFSGVTEVVRGRDILPSTPQQICLSRLLCLPVPLYRHVPLLLAPDGHRLAKRNRDVTLEGLSRRMSRDALLGVLAHAAGQLPEPREISLSRLIRDFDWEKVPLPDISLPASLLEG